MLKILKFFISIKRCEKLWCHRFGRVPHTTPANLTLLEHLVTAAVAQSVNKVSQGSAKEATDVSLIPGGGTEYKEKKS